MSKVIHLPDAAHKMAKKFCRVKVRQATSASRTHGLVDFRLSMATVSATLMPIMDSTAKTETVKTGVTGHIWQVMLQW